MAASMEDKRKLKEASYFCLESQLNVYSLTTVIKSDGQHKLLVASLRGKVVLIEYQNSRPLSKEVHFTYIPGDADIVSIHAFNKHQYGKGIVVGITFVKVVENEQSQFLNIYSEWDSGAEFDLDRIAQGCQNIELTFIPFQLYHTELLQNSGLETVFLLSGSDLKVHLYREDRYSHTFSEMPSEDYFPEFNQLQSSIWCMECLYLEERKKRLTVYGCMDGTLCVSIIDTKTKEILKQFKKDLDGPITSVRLFSLNSSVTCPSYVGEDFISHDVDVDEQCLHLLVTSSLEAAVVYSNVAEHGFSEGLVLPDSDAYDSVYCCCVTDVDFDGQVELVLGTYGQELLVYKFVSWTPRKRWQVDELSNNVKSGSSERKHSVSAPTSPQKTFIGDDEEVHCNTEQVAHSNGDKKELKGDEISTKEAHLGHRGSLGSNHSGCSNVGSLVEGEFQLLWQLGLSHPIVALAEVDITCDGLMEIAALSLKGLHILQHNLENAAELCLERLKEARRGQSEDVFQQLQQETL